MPTLTSTYPFKSLAIGDSFTVYNDFQHCRVAASEYGRKHGQCYTCRMADEPRRMTITRCKDSQAVIDQRGRSGRREIPLVPTTIVEPSRSQYLEWLATFAPGQSYRMPASYTHLFGNMMLWTAQFSQSTGHMYTAGLMADGSLSIFYVA